MAVKHLMFWLYTFECDILKCGEHLNSYLKNEVLGYDKQGKCSFVSILEV